MDLRPTLLALLLFAASPMAQAATPLHALPAPMLASRMPDGIDVAAYLVSEKLDGVRARWDGRALWTRAGTRIDAPAWFTRGWPPLPMEGELWIGRGRFQQVSDTVRAMAMDDAAWRPIRFMAFDLPGADAAFAQRHRQLRAVLAGGGEGLMLQHALAPYRAGRSDTLLKLKQGRDAEARVIGYRPGKGKYAGMTGALLVEDAHGRRFALGSGLRDADRAVPPAIGSIVTFRYDGLTAKGTPRFARFQRVRRD